MTRTEKGCLTFFDEIDAVGGSWFDDGAGGNRVQRTVLEEINQMDGFDPCENMKGLTATY